MTISDKNTQTGVSDEARLMRMKQALSLSAALVLIAVLLLYFFINNALTSHHGLLDVLVSWKMFVCGVLLMMAGGSFQTYKEFKNATVEGGLYHVDYNQLRWLPSDQNLPMNTIIKGSTVVGIILSLFGGGIFYLLIYSIVMGTIQKGFNWGWFLMYIPFFLFFLFFFLGGLSMIFGRKYIEIAPEMVHCQAIGLFSRKEWQEPVSNYEGVATRVMRRPKSSDIYFVDLRHRKDMGKDIVLWQSYSGYGQNDAKIRFSHLLNLPAL